jgi:hypothetical protein
MDRDEDAVTRHVTDFVKTGARRAVDELAYARFGPLDPLAVEAAVQVYHKLADDED